VRTDARTNDQQKAATHTQLSHNPEYHIHNYHMILNIRKQNQMQDSTIYCFRIHTNNNTGTQDIHIFHWTHDGYNLRRNIIILFVVNRTKTKKYTLIPHSTLQKFVVHFSHTIQPKEE